MTSASELFHSRRHRFGRTTLQLGLDTELHAVDSLRRHHHHVRRHQSERGSDARYRRSLFSHSVDSLRSPFRVSSSERLPVGVVLARARLLQRLRGEPLLTNRQHDRDSVGEDREYESSNEVPTGASLVTDLTSQMGRSQLLQELNEKPPGLSQEALDCLHQEVFSSNDIGLESRVLQDCSICLESFTDGDELIRLPCGHKFHSVCLDPWIRYCGDCPYCRRCIVVQKLKLLNEDE